MSYHVAMGTDHSTRLAISRGISACAALIGGDDLLKLYNSKRKPLAGTAIAVAANSLDALCIACDEWWTTDRARQDFWLENSATLQSPCIMLVEACCAMAMTRNDAGRLMRALDRQLDAGERAESMPHQILSEVFSVAYEIVADLAVSYGDTAPSELS